MHLVCPTQVQEGFNKLPGIQGEKGLQFRHHQSGAGVPKTNSFSNTFDRKYN